MVFETWLESDLKKPVQVKQLHGNLFSGDIEGNMIGVRILDNGEPATGISGDVKGYAILGNNATIPMDGDLSGNEASILLAEDVYKVVGPISIVIKVGATTVGACTSYVYRTATETPLDPTGIVPDVATLLGKIALWEAVAQGSENVNITSGKTVTQNGNEVSVATTDRQNQTVTTVIREPEISASKSGKVVTITAKGTNAAGTGWKTPEVVTITEPTMSITERDGDFDVNINGVKEVTIPNPNKELSDRAHVETVSRSKTRIGNPIVIEDAVAEIADKMVIKLEPRQDLHGYDKPWVGGAGKNINTGGIARTNTVTGVDFEVDTTDHSILINGTNTHATTHAFMNFDYTLGTLMYPVGVDFYIDYYPHIAGVAIGLCATIDGATSTIIRTSVGANGTIPDTATASWIRVFVAPGTTLNNTKVYPFLCLNSEPDKSFAPYENICPITGYDTVNVKRTSRNIVPNGTDTSNGFVNSSYIDENGNVSTSGNWMVSEYFIIKPSTNYMWINPSVVTYAAAGICFYDENKNFISGIRKNSIRILQISTPENAVYCRLSQRKTMLSWLTEGNDVTEYESTEAAYSIAVSLAEDSNHSPAGTVYGGTVTINADGSGTVVVDKLKKTYTSSDGWSFIAGSPNRILVAEDTLMAPSIVGGYPGWSNLFPVKTDYDSAKIAEFNGSMILSASNYSTSHRRIAIFSDKINSVEEFGNLVSNQPLEVVFPAATPVVYELTANQVQTLLGYNYIYTDGAEITLTFRQQILASNDTLLKLFPTGTATGNPAVISDGAEGVPLKNLTVNIEPKQEGTGDPSPSNIRPISGWTAVDVIRANGTDSEEEGYEEKTYSISLPSEAGTVYGGTLTLDQNGEGTLTVDRMKKTYSDSTGFTLNTSLTFNRFIAEVTDMASPVVGGHPGWSNQFPIATDYIAGANMSDNTIYLAPLRYSSTKNYLIICAGQFATLEDFGTWLASNPLEVVMPIASPTTYTLTAEQVKTLLGTNYISCDAGSMNIEYFKAITEPDLSAYATKEYVDENAALVVTIPVSSGTNSITAFGGTKYGEYKAVAFHGANPGIFSSMTVQTSTSYVSAFGDYNNGISVSCTFASASTAIAVVTIVLQKVAKVRTYTRNGSTYSYTDSTPLSHTTVFDV